MELNPQGNHVDQRGRMPLVVETNQKNQGVTPKE